MWRRVSVDLDETRRPIGWSVEWHDDDGALLEIACGTPGPFDQVLDAFAEASIQTMRQQRLEL